MARSLDGEASSPSPSLRHKLRTTVCCCFGRGAGAGGERVRWRRRATTGEFRYDPLGYALNFDEGEDDGAGADAAAAFRCRNFNSRLPPSPVSAPAQRPTAIAMA
ncbi:uncharacterized protein LOC133927113 [Phragmites australis]|uniref:uncharacterized protein LOC133927113 n=1 Tax=Phragmites australis TaxID=29695 RepID=UPI002D776FB3|nr:uncharacterized protein LOC133927113 [Phragmites australis]